MLFQIQQALSQVGAISFTVVPMFKAKMRHIQYGDSALLESIKLHRAKYPSSPLPIATDLAIQDARIYWSQTFNIERFEHAAQQMNFYNI